MILDLLVKVCAALEARNIEYMLSGSLAMNIYTTPRMTRDIDIVINLKLSDVKEFNEIFKDGYYLNEEGVVEEIKRHGMFNVIDFESGLKIDFIIRKATEFNINEFERRKKTSILDFETYVVSLEDLVISKLSWIQDYQSEQQIRDIRNLVASDNIDMKYVKQWIKRLKLKTYNIFDNE